MVPSTIPTQDKANQNSILEREGTHQTPPLAEELLLIHTYLERENNFSVEVIVLACFPGSSEWFHIYNIFCLVSYQKNEDKKGKT